MKTINKILTACVLGLALFTGCKESHDLAKRLYGDLDKEDYQKATWIKYHNESGRIWTPYMNENIKHNQPNWYGYTKNVKEKNKGKTKGNILLPDLDGDGKVGK